jgi:hypothetical protein
MARGWESKSVEDQIGAAEAKRQERGRPQLSDPERKRQERRQSLLLSRSQIISRLRGVTNDRYRKQLTTALEHLDAQLKELE